MGRWKVTMAMIVICLILCACSIGEVKEEANAMWCPGGAAILFGAWLLSRWGI